MLFLQIRAFCSYYTLATCRETSETSSDCFTSSFLRITALIEQYLKLRQGTQSLKIGPLRAEHQTRANIFEWGVLQALYIVAIKCRDPACRRRGAKLLCQIRRREANIESEDLAYYAEAVIQLEERRAGGLTSEAMVRHLNSFIMSPNHISSCYDHGAGFAMPS